MAIELYQCLALARIGSQGVSLPTLSPETRFEIHQFKNAARCVPIKHILERIYVDCACTQECTYLLTN